MTSIKESKAAGRARRTGNPNVITLLDKARENRARGRRVLAKTQAVFAILLAVGLQRNSFIKIL